MDFVDWLLVVGMVISGFCILLAQFGGDKIQKYKDGTYHYERWSYRNRNHSSAKIISDTQIQVTNLDDVDKANMDRWHVSMLKVRTNMGHGVWIYEFDKPMGVLGTESEQMMYMREAEASLNDHIDTFVNPEKDRWGDW